MYRKNAIESRSCILKTTTTFRAHWLSLASYLHARFSSPLYRSSFGIYSGNFIVSLILMHMLKQNPNEKKNKTNNASQARSEYCCNYKQQGKKAEPFHLFDLAFDANLPNNFTLMSTRNHKIAFIFLVSSTFKTHFDCWMCVLSVRSKHTDADPDAHIERVSTSYGAYTVKCTKFATLWSEPCCAIPYSVLFAIVVWQAYIAMIKLYPTTITGREKKTAEICLQLQFCFRVWS